MPSYFSLILHHLVYITRRPPPFFVIDPTRFTSYHCLPWFSSRPHILHPSPHLSYTIVIMFFLLHSPYISLYLFPSNTALLFQLLPTPISLIHPLDSPTSTTPTVILIPSSLLFTLHLPTPLLSIHLDLPSSSYLYLLLHSSYTQQYNNTNIHLIVSRTLPDLLSLQTQHHSTQYGLSYATRQIPPFCINILVNLTFYTTIRPIYTLYFIISKTLLYTLPSHLSITQTVEEPLTQIVIILTLIFFLPFLHTISCLLLLCHYGFCSSFW